MALGAVDVFLTAVPDGDVVVAGAFGATFLAGGCCAPTESRQDTNPMVIIFIRIVNPSLFQIAGDNTRRDLGSDIIKCTASVPWRSKSPFPPNPAFGFVPVLRRLGGF